VLPAEAQDLLRPPPGRGVGANGRHLESEVQASLGGMLGGMHTLGRCCEAGAALDGVERGNASGRGGEGGGGYRSG